MKYEIHSLSLYFPEISVGSVFDSDKEMLFGIDKIKLFLAFASNFVEKNSPLNALHGLEALNFRKSVHA